MVVCWWSALRRRAYRSPKRCTPRADRSHCRSASTSGLPRVYRGKDIMWWLDRTGVLDERFDEVDDLVRARNVPSPQLVGTPSAGLST